MFKAKLTVVPEKLFMDDVLPMPALALLARFRSHSDENVLIEPSVEALCQRWNVPLAHFDVLLEHLIDHGYVQVICRAPQSTPKRNWEVRPPIHRTDHSETP